MKSIQGKALSNLNKLFHFIGLGGAGSNVLEGIYAKGFHAKFTCISNPARPHLPDKIHFLKFIPPGQTSYPRGRASSGFSDLNTPLHLTREIKEVFTENERYILLAGLGGYTGTKLVEQLITWLHENDKEFMVICSMPYAFEGERRLYASSIVKKFQMLPNFHYYDPELDFEELGSLTIKATNEKFWVLFKENYLKV